MGCKEKIKTELQVLDVKRTVTLSSNSTPRKAKSLQLSAGFSMWYSQGDSNPCYRRERAVS